LYCSGGVEKSKGGGGEEGKDGDAAFFFAHAVAPAGAPSAAAAGLYGEWRGYRKTRCCAERRRFRKVQVTRSDSVFRRAKFGNWCFAAEHGSQVAWFMNTGVVS
jgi:hypothetical protein